MPADDHTAATRALDAAGIPYERRTYAYVERGGTAHAARALAVDEHAVVKTLVFDAGAAGPAIVLMHGDRKVSAKRLARELGVRQVAPARPADVLRCTGYRVGGVSPFGVRTSMPVLAERGILDLDRIYLNGGRRGLLVVLAPDEAVHALEARLVELS